MTLSKFHMGMPGDECQCGRRASVRHCPQCGSFRMYGYVKKEPVIVNGVIEYLGKYRCQACGHVFLDRDREFCVAPVHTSNEALARMQIQRAIAAKDDGQPLTDKERLIIKAVDPTPMTPDDQRELEITVDQERGWRLEWAKLRLLNKPTTSTVDEYLRQKALMLEAASKGGKT